MSRSVKKGPFVAFSLVKKIDALNAANDKKIVKTWSRASTILPSFLPCVPGPDRNQTTS